MEPISTAIAGLGALANGFFQWYGMDKQAEENRKAREENRRMFAEQMGIEQAQFNRQQTLAEKKYSTEASMARETMNLEKEQLKRKQQDLEFEKRAKVLGGITALLNSNMNIRMALMGANRGA